jgi:chromosome segregation ATPase
MKYRSMLLNAEDMHSRKLTEDTDTKELIANHPTVTLLTERNRDLEQRLLEAQKQFAELQLNHEQIELDAMRLYEAIELLKAKYSTVLEEKKELATELIKKEEEKLELARGIVELKIAQSQSSEKAEKELFEATSSMLAMKNEIYEMDGREQLLKVPFLHLSLPYFPLLSLLCCSLCCICLSRCNCQSCKRSMMKSLPCLSEKERVESL